MRKPFVAAIFALCFLPVAAEEARDGAASRERIDAESYPWRTFGRVNRQGHRRGFCSGVLIAPDVALTAAHCLYDAKRGAWAEPRFIHFVAAYQKGRFLFTSKASRYEVAKGYTPGGKRRDAIDSARDWAVLHLAEAAGPEIGYLGLSRLRPGDRLESKPIFTLAGYGRDRPFALSADGACGLLRWDGAAALVHHDCRADNGTSGAPIIRRNGADFVVVALHVGRGEVAREEIGAAVPSGNFFEVAAAAAGRRIRPTPGLGPTMAGSRVK